MPSIGSATFRLELDKGALNRGLVAAERQIGGSLKRLGDTVSKTGLLMTAAISAPILLLSGLSVKTFAGFEQGMKNVQAVSGATGEELQDLTDIAKEMGETTKFTATQSTEALSFMAMAGMDVGTMLEALPRVLELAASANLDLGTAADIVTNTMAGFNLEASDLTMVNDVMVASFTNANTDLTQMGQAFKFAGPVANAAGISFTETAAALSLMGNAGIQASMAGTSLRGAIVRLLNPTGDAVDLIEKYGVTVTDLDGKMMPLNTIIKSFEENNLTAADAMEIFGQRAGPAMLALMSQGSEAMVDFDLMLQDAGGTAEFVAETQMDSLQGSIITMGSAFEGLQITIGEFLSGALRPFVDLLTETIRDVNAFTKEILPVWETALGQVADKFKETKDPIQAFKDLIEVTMMIFDKTQKVSGFKGAIGAIAPAIITVLAALGPLLFILGKLISLAGTLITPLMQIARIAIMMNPWVRVAVIFGMVILANEELRTGFLALGKELVEKIIPFVQEVMTAFMEFGMALTNLLVPIVTILATILLKVAEVVLPPLMDAILFLVRNAIVPLTEGLTWLMNILAENEIAIAIITGALIGLIIVMFPIPIAILAIITALVLLVNNFDLIIDFFTTTLPNFFTSLPSILLPLLESALEKVGAIFLSLGGIIGGAIVDVAGMIGGQFEKLGTAILDWFKGFLDPKTFGKRVGIAVAALIIALFPIPVLIIVFRKKIGKFFADVGKAFFEFMTSTLPNFVMDNWLNILTVLFPIPLLIIRFREEIAGFFIMVAEEFINFMTSTLPNFVMDNWQLILLALFPIPVMLIHFRDEIFSFFEGAAGEFFSAMMGFVDWVIKGEGWKVILTALFPPLAMAFWGEQITGFFLSATTAAFGIWLDGVKAFLQLGLTIWPWVKEAFMGFLEGIVEVLAMIWGSGIISEWVTDLGSWLTANVNPWEWVKAAWDLFQEEIGERIRAVFSMIGGIPAGVIEAIGNVAGTLAQKGRDLIDGLIGGVVEIWDREKRFFSGLPAKILSTLGGLTGTLAQKGKDLIFGFSNAINLAINGAGGLIVNVRNWGSWIADALVSGFKNVWNVAANSINSIIPNEITFGGQDLGILGSLPSVTINLPDNPFPRLLRGGPVRAGLDYIVGEAGPELFKSAIPGTMIPNNALANPPAAVIPNIGGAAIGAGLSEVQASASDLSEGSGRGLLIDLRGSQFNGTPEENAEAIRSLFDDFVESDFGVDGEAWGVRTI